MQMGACLHDECCRPQQESQVDTAATAVGGHCAAMVYVWRYNWRQRDCGGAATLLSPARGPGVKQ